MKPKAVWHKYPDTCPTKSCHYLVVTDDTFVRVAEYVTGLNLFWNIDHMIVY